MTCGRMSRDSGRDSFGTDQRMAGSAPAFKMLPQFWRHARVQFLIGHIDFSKAIVQRRSGQRLWPNWS